MPTELMSMRAGFPSLSLNMKNTKGKTKSVDYFVNGSGKSLYGSNEICLSQRKMANLTKKWQKQRRIICQLLSGELLPC